ncbi:MAG: GTP diphosphokinase [Gammaproteobacteria bacterium]|nr:MAG: GTP diphosphokinase [Gammaproteobacteria bacterium]
MVKIRKTIDKSLLADGAPGDWLEQIQFERDDEMTPILDALTLARDSVTEHQELKTAGIRQGLDMAGILAGLKLDSETLAAASIYGLVRDEILSLKLVKEKLGPGIGKLLSGVNKMASVRSLQTSAKVKGKVAMDPLRHMLLAMVDDSRVILIKLAEQVSLLHSARNWDEAKRLELAIETKDIYAPLANRLGIGQLKWELEDFSFRYLDPEQYKTIAKSLSEKRIDRDIYIKDIVTLLLDELKKLGVHAEIEGRAKHIYSIWRKMQRKNIGFEEIYDTRAVRIVVNEVQECYSALGVVHSRWSHIPKEFDDYVATPKENGYQSIHTAVIGPEGKALEVQIRTHQMHQESEQGVAAHWRYKEGGKVGATGYEKKIAWLRELLEWQEELADSEELLQDFREQVVEDRVYVFTPGGEIVDLPPTSTPLDFAYRIHTQVGHTCRGAKVNGRIVPLTYQLNTGEQVDVLTSKKGTPSRDWMNPTMGYLKSSRARSKIHQYFRHQDKDKNILAGKPILDKELQRQGLKDVNLLTLAKKYNYKAIEDLYAGIGAGDLRLHQVGNAARLLMTPQQDIEQPVKIQKPHKSRKKAIKGKGITVEGVDNLLSAIAGCCKPVPGDEIVGFISRTRGVVIHRNDCNHILRAQEDNFERLIEVDWGEATEFYVVDVAIRAYDRQGLLRDITTVLANNDVGVITLNTNSKRVTDLMFDISLQIEVPSTEILGEILNALNRLPNVSEVKRR